MAACSGNQKRTKSYSLIWKKSTSVISFQRLAIKVTSKALLMSSRTFFSKNGEFKFLPIKTGQFLGGDKLWAGLAMGYPATPPPLPPGI